MPRLLLVLLLLTLPALSACKKRSKKPDDPMLAFKRLDELPVFELEVSDAARASLAKEPRTWVLGTFRFKDETYRDVGVRLKGHRSMRKLDDKPALKLRFDKVKKKQRFKKTKYLTLNNMVEDPTMLREVLGYRLYRELGVHAPTAFYARLRLNGEDYGLYAIIETVDKRFLKQRFDDASGGLYEGEYGCDLYVDDVEGFDRDSGKKGDRGALRALAKLVDDDPRRVLSDDGPINMKSFLAYLAVSAFIGDFDGYRHAHNYRIYHEPTEGKWYFIPWGIDRAFKKQLSIYESFGRLARLCFDDAACRARYVRVQREVVRAFVKLDLEQGALALAAFIEPVVSTSTTRTPSSATINRAREQLLTFLRERPDSIARETACIGADDREIDADGDGYSCLDCDDTDATVHPGAEEACDGRDNDCSGYVDDSASCPTCTNVDVGEQRFAVCNLPRSFDEAERYCQDLGGHLATIGSAEANEALYKIARPLAKERWWIGLHDRAVEGEFVAVGASAAYRNWTGSEPNNSTCNQDCAVFDARKKGVWRDTHCGQWFPFICSLAKKN